MASTEGSRGGKNTGGSATGEVKRGLGQVRDKASQTAKQAQQRGRARLERGKEAAADQVQQLAGAVEDFAGKLGDTNAFSGYAADFGRRLSAFADGLRDRSIDELADDARELARRNPTMYLLGSVAVGMALARFMKASARRPRAGDAQGQGLGYRSFESGSLSEDSLYAPAGAGGTPSAGTDRPTGH